MDRILKRLVSNILPGRYSLSFSGMSTAKIVDRWFRPKRFLFMKYYSVVFLISVFSFLFLSGRMLEWGLFGGLKAHQSYPFLRVVFVLLKVIFLLVIRIVLSLVGFSLCKWKMQNSVIWKKVLKKIKKL